MSIRTVALPVAAGEDLFAARLAADRQPLRRRAIRTLQLNVGKMCNLACHHCHVEAGPKRTEIMTWDVMASVLDWLDAHHPALGTQVVDLTGGAPEMNPHFRRFVEALKARGLHVLDRCNLTILLDPGYEDMIPFLARHKVEIVASLPCYLEDNVDKQRGRGVFHDSIEALRRLNAAGYGVDGSNLRLDLVYNPTGYGLPPPQEALEADYKRELSARFDIAFNRLWTITNMPIKRFEHALRRDGKYDAYVAKLLAAHNPANVDGVMCRDLVSVGWQGTVYDCDFNQMLGLALAGHPGPAATEHEIEAGGRKLWEFSAADLLDRPILTGTHCFGCTAGAGSSCTGALS
ncbi:MAG TPA: arsenosugar biosynthesis radical SAM (seleno)protein ArsS [Tepidisphaeraceae bacterium]|nr:arsenosugar biosynthesis radical SAM (seleno)protein ArsS [Tepidisphaeraceae bacterium]